MKKLVTVLSFVVWLLSIYLLFVIKNDLATYFLVLALFLRYGADRA